MKHIGIFKKKLDKTVFAIIYQYDTGARYDYLGQSQLRLLKFTATNSLEDIAKNLADKYFGQDEEYPSSDLEILTNKPDIVELSNNDENAKTVVVSYDIKTAAKAFGLNGVAINSFQGHPKAFTDEWNIANTK